MRSPGRPPQRAKFPCAILFLRGEKGEKWKLFRGESEQDRFPVIFYCKFSENVPMERFQQMIHNIRKEYIYGIYNRCGLRYKRYKDSSF